MYRCLFCTLAFERRYINEVLFTIKYTFYSLKSADSENIYFTLLNCNACCPVAVLRIFRKHNSSGNGLIKKYEIIATPKYASNCQNFGIWITNAYRNKGKLEENNFCQLYFFTVISESPYSAAYAHSMQKLGGMSHLHLDM